MRPFTKATIVVLLLALLAAAIVQVIAFVSEEPASPPEARAVRMAS